MLIQYHVYAMQFYRAQPKFDRSALPFPVTTRVFASRVSPHHRNTQESVKLQEDVANLAYGLSASNGTRRARGAAGRTNSCGESASLHLTHREVYSKGANQPVRKARKAASCGHVEMCICVFVPADN